MKYRVLSACVLLLLLLPAGPHPSAQVGWTPPVGMPAPPFGIGEVARAAPSPWTSATAGFYYVEASASNATDTNNPYGTPASPRLTIPRTLPAGSVVELRGTYSTSHRSPAALTLNGTASNPVFIRGQSPSVRPLITEAWQVGGSHFILENLAFSIGRQLALHAPLHRGVLRYSEVRGTPTGGGIGIGGGAGWPVTDLLLFRNQIHDNGDVGASFDQDIHGIAVAAYVNNLWVLENELYRNSGDGIQINAGNKTLQPTTARIYVGRNSSHHNKQTGMWTKQATDVVFSENLVYAHRPSNSSYGACMGFQYAPERVWFINNHIHDCEVGIAFSSGSDLGTGEYAFIIGNVIHNIHATTGFNPGGWGQSALMLAGGVNRFVGNNTIYDVDAGILSPGGGALAIVNNIIANVTQPGGMHIFVENGVTAGASSVNNNLLGGTAKIKWGSSAVYNVSTFLSTFGKGQGNINADPLFVNPASKQFQLQAGSPAIDSGLNLASLYAGFTSALGVDLAVDPDGVTRGQNGAWDIGSYEFGTAGTGGPPRAPTNLRIIR